LFALLSSIHLSRSWNLVLERSGEWLIAASCMTLTCYGLLNGSLFAVAGVALFVFMPQALRAIGSNVQGSTLPKTIEAE
jgi:hypothetical protein